MGGKTSKHPDWNETDRRWPQGVSSRIAQLILIRIRELLTLFNEFECGKFIISGVWECDGKIKQNLTILGCTHHEEEVPSWNSK